MAQLDGLRHLQPVLGGAELVRAGQQHVVAFVLEQAETRGAALALVVDVDAPGRPAASSTRSYPPLRP